MGLVEIRVSCGNMEVGLSGSRDQSGNLIGGVKECEWFWAGNTFRDDEI